jgi:sulfate permease, SulP family
MLTGLQEDLAKAAIALRLVEAHAEVRDLLRLEGLEAKVGRIDRSETVADAVDQFQEAARGHSSAGPERSGPGPI